jgi:hypothetical protein
MARVTTSCHPRAVRPLASAAPGCIVPSMVSQASTTRLPEPGASPEHDNRAAGSSSGTKDQGLRTEDPSPSPPQSPLPPLSDRDSHLLAAFLIYRFDLPTLADREKLHPTQLLAFTQSPAVAAHLAAYRKFADEAFHLRSLESRTSAINLLEDLAKKSSDPVEKRRCASAIIRGLSIPITRTFKPSTFLHPPHRPNQSHPTAPTTDATTESSAAREPGRPRPGSDHPVQPTPIEDASFRTARRKPPAHAHAPPDSPPENSPKPSASRQRAPSTVPLTISAPRPSPLHPSTPSPTHSSSALSTQSSALPPTSSPTSKPPPPPSPDPSPSSHSPAASRGPPSP